MCEACAMQLAAAAGCQPCSQEKPIWVPPLVQPVNTQRSGKKRSRWCTAVPCEVCALQLAAVVD